jgi:hypothetical protein
MASNRAQILISAVDQTKTAFDSIKRGLGGLTDTAKSVNGVLANLGVAVSVAGLTAMVKSAIDTAMRWTRCRSVSVSASKPCRCGNRQPSSPACRANRSRRAAQAVHHDAGSRDRLGRCRARNFAAVGVAFKNQDGTLRGTDQVLLDLAERFKAMPDGAEKTALAVRNCSASPARS